MGDGTYDRSVLPYEAEATRMMRDVEAMRRKRWRMTRDRAEGPGSGRTVMRGTEVEVIAQTYRWHVSFGFERFFLVRPLHSTLMVTAHPDELEEIR